MLGNLKMNGGESQSEFMQGVTAGKWSKMLGGQATVKFDQNLLVLAVQRQRTEWEAMYMLLILLELEYDTDSKYAIL